MIPIIIMYLIAIPFAYLILLNLFDDWERKDVIPVRLLVASLLFPLTFVFIGTLLVISYALGIGEVYLNKFHKWAETKVS